MGRHGRDEEVTRTLDCAGEVPQFVPDERTDKHEVEARGSGPLAAGARPYIVGLSGGVQGDILTLDRETTLIGRAPEAGLRLIDASVSRHHATIQSSQGRAVLVDLCSSNGTFVNGTRVRKRTLAHGDRVQIGSVLFRYSQARDALDESIQQELYRSAVRDELTGAFNRRYFLERLDAEHRFARRHRVPLEVMLIDFDHFKRINDEHGHLGGDHALVEVTRRILQTIRQEDLLARFGGDELAVTCRGIAQAQAAILAERIRAAVSAHPTSFGGRSIAVTLTVGVAGLPDVAADSRDELLAAADRSLYAAKRAGRDRVATAC